MILGIDLRSALLLNLLFIGFLLSPSPISAAETSSFLYTAGGQRVVKLEASGNHTYYLPGAEVVVKPDGTTSYRRYYSFNGNLAAIREDTEVTYLHRDNLGSLALTTDPQGNPLAEASYYPYGLTKGAAGTLAGERRYTGQVSDENLSGLYYYNARYYSPTLGRFTQPDTVDSGLNRYAYVGNNPVNLTDPSGHCEPNDFICWYNQILSVTTNLWEEEYDPIVPFGEPLGEPVNRVFAEGSDLPQMGYIDENLVNSQEFRLYALNILSQTEFTSDNLLNFYESLTTSIYNNSNFNESASQAYGENGNQIEQIIWNLNYTIQQGNTIETILNNQGVCFEFAVIENYFLGQSGIQSTVLITTYQSGDLINQHAFVGVYLDNTLYILDPSTGQVMTETDYRNYYQFTEPFYEAGSLYQQPSPLAESD